MEEEELRATHLLKFIDHFLTPFVVVKTSLTHIEMTPKGVWRDEDTKGTVRGQSGQGISNNTDSEKVQQRSH